MIEMPSNTRAVFDVIRAGNALDTSILGNVTNVRDQMEAAIAALPTTEGSGSGEEGSGGVSDGALAEVREKLDSLMSDEGMFSSLQNHLQNQFANLPRNLNLYVSNFGLNQGLGTIPQFPTIPPVFGAGGIGAETAPQSIGDICAGINEFFGSLIGQAQEFLQQIGNLIDQLMDAIAQGIETVLALIDQIVNQIMEVANQVTQMIANEMARIQEALTEALSFVNALSFQNIFNHPCAKTVLGAVGSGALIAALTMR